jgi:hypothetical protein
LKSHITTVDIFNNSKQGFEDPRDLEAVRLKQREPSDLSCPRSRGRTASSSGVRGVDYGGIDGKINSSEFLSESSVSGGAGHGPSSIGYTSQNTANTCWEASLNDNKKAGDSRQWNIQRKVAAPQDPTPLELEPEDGVKYVARAEVNRNFQTILRNQRPAQDVLRRRSKSGGEMSGSVEGTPRSTSSRTPRSLRSRVSSSASNTVERRVSRRATEPPRRIADPSKSPRSSRERDIIDIGKELERHIGGQQRQHERLISEVPTVRSASQATHDNVEQYTDVAVKAQPPGRS